MRFGRTVPVFLPSSCVHTQSAIWILHIGPHVYMCVYACISCNSDCFECLKGKIGVLNYYVYALYLLLDNISFGAWLKYKRHTPNCFIDRFFVVFVVTLLFTCIDTLFAVQNWSHFMPVFYDLLLFTQKYYLHRQ